MLAPYPGAAAPAVTAAYALAAVGAARATARVTIGAETWDIGRDLDAGQAWVRAGRAQGGR